MKHAEERIKKKKKKKKSERVIRELSCILFQQHEQIHKVSDSLLFPSRAIIVV